MARPKGSGNKLKIGDVQPREDLDLGSGEQSDELEDEETGELEDEEIKPEQSDEQLDAKADQKIITENSEAGGTGSANIIQELMKSDLSKPPESQDIQYFTQEEYDLGTQVNTLKEMLVEDPNKSSSGHTGPWIERCVGRDPETRKLRVVRIPAKYIPINPDMIVEYLGSVVQDHQAVHSPSVVYQKRRWGYSFDRFYYHNGKRLDRCALVLDKIHQAGLLYEKMVDRKTRKPFARIRQMKGPSGKGTGNPMYKIPGVQEGYYRDLRRLFERHFLNRGDESLAEDIGLKVLIGGS